MRILRIGADARESMNLGGEGSLWNGLALAEGTAVVIARAKITGG
jgi:hypothetical protein